MINQGMVEGEVTLTPIQKWFFDKNFEVENHWNQSMMIFSKDGFEEELVCKVFDSIVGHHDALRMGYRKENGEIKQINRDLKSNLYDISVYDFTKDNNFEEKVITDICTEIQGSIDIEKGPLVKLGLFKTKNGDHLLMAIHHLVIDGVSWRIILEDFSNGYNLAKNNEKIVLPEKTTSFKEWAEKQKEFVNSYEIKKQVEYWKSIEETNIERLPRDKEAINPLFSEIKTLTNVLSEEETENLLKKVNKAYTTEINDILLSALSITLNKWTNSDNILINLESHGREEIIDNVDITRTIGWFTSQYPVILNGNKEDLAITIKNTKDMLRKIPNKGIGYGIIRYLDNGKYNFISKLKPEVCFNYLGEFGELSK